VNPNTLRNEMMKAVSLVLAAILSSVVVGAAHATARNAETLQKEIRFEDLNLNHSAGAKRLYQRIRLAARQLCGEPNRLITARADSARLCANEATARAVERVNSPLLTKHHASM
jgi:UrcA family protein